MAHVTLVGSLDSGVRSFCTISPDVKSSIARQNAANDELCSRSPKGEVLEAIETEIMRQTKRFGRHGFHV